MQVCRRHDCQYKCNFEMYLQSCRRQIIVYIIVANGLFPLLSLAGFGDGAELVQKCVCNLANAILPKVIGALGKFKDQLKSAMGEESDQYKAVLGQHSRIRLYLGVCYAASIAFVNIKALRC